MNNSVGLTMLRTTLLRTTLLRTTLLRTTRLISAVGMVMVMGVLMGMLLVSPAFAMGGTLPKLNQPAPEFTLPTNTGDGHISLSDYRGKWLVAYFYPKDFTSGCTLEAQRFQKDLPKYLDRNAAIVGISADSVDSHAEFCDSEGLKFPLLADETGSVSKAYGSWLGYVSSRHTFIINPDGLLKATFLGVNPIVHSREVLAKLDELTSDLPTGGG
jgi:thioredoxin-dependent peroxiredoxin